jgi:hypothetical protein
MPFPNLKGRPRSIPEPAKVLAAWNKAKAKDRKLTKAAFAQYTLGISPRHFSRVLKQAQTLSLSPPNNESPKGSSFTFAWT